MSKTEIYSWRLSTELKVSLEEAARSADRSVADLLDEIASEWLAESNEDRAAMEEEQERLRRRASRFVGSLAGGRPDRSSTVREQVRKKLLASRAG